MRKTVTWVRGKHEGVRIQGDVTIDYLLSQIKARQLPVNPESLPGLEDFLRSGRNSFLHVLDRGGLIEEKGTVTVRSHAARIGLTLDMTEELKEAKILTSTYGILLSNGLSLPDRMHLDYADNIALVTPGTLAFFAHRKNRFGILDEEVMEFYEKPVLRNCAVQMAKCFLDQNELGRVFSARSLGPVVLYDIAKSVRPESNIDQRFRLVNLNY